METQNNPPTTRKQRIILWLKRLGVVGFLFFLIKGLVWIAVFYFAGKTIVK